MFCPNNKKTEIEQSPNSTPITQQLFNSIHHVPKKYWDYFLSHDQLFLKRPYLSVVEDTHSDTISCRYVVLFQAKKVVGVAYFQILKVKDNFFTLENQKNIVAIEGGAMAQMRHHLKKIVQRTINSFSIRLLICGNVFITGDYGFYYNKKRLSSEKAFAMLNKAAEQIQTEELLQRNPITAILMKDFHPLNLEKAKTLENYSYKEITAYPNMVLKVLDRWGKFEDYLQSMSSKYRVRAKNYRKKGKLLVRKELTSSDIQAQSTQIHEFYKYIADQADFNLTYASAQYFADLKKQMGEQYQLLGYYLQDKLVGFISLFLNNSGGHLEAHFIGYDQKLNRQYRIYPNILYDLVQIGIESQMKSISFGRTALEIKSTIGAVGVQMNSFFRHRSCLTNTLLRPVLNNLKQDDWIPRQPFRKEILEQSLQTVQAAGSNKKMKRISKPISN